MIIKLPAIKHKRFMLATNFLRRYMMRNSWSSTLNYILVTAGATIGFGATWRFPYLVGQMVVEHMT